MIGLERLFVLMGGLYVYGEDAFDFKCPAISVALTSEKKATTMSAGDAYLNTSIPLMYALVNGSADASTPNTEFIIEEDFPVLNTISAEIAMENMSFVKPKLHNFLKKDVCSMEIPT